MGDTGDAGDANLSDTQLDGASHADEEIESRKNFPPTPTGRRKYTTQYW